MLSTRFVFGCSSDWFFFFEDKERSYTSFTVWEGRLWKLWTNFWSRDKTKPTGGNVVVCVCKRSQWHDKTHVTSLVGLYSFFILGESEKLNSVSHPISSQLKCTKEWQIFSISTLGVLGASLGSLWKLFWRWLRVCSKTSTKVWMSREWKDSLTGATAICCALSARWVSLAREVESKTKVKPTVVLWIWVRPISHSEQHTLNEGITAVLGTLNR